MNHSVSPTLASSAQGRVFYCACKDRVTMRFKERWFAFGRTELPGFRDCLLHLINDPALIRRLLAEALDEAAARGLSADSLPTLEDLTEMLGLVDDSLLILEAQAIAGAAHG